MRKIYYLLMFAICALAATPVKAQVQLTQINTAYQQDFDSLANSGTTNDITTLPHGWTFLETGTNANVTYASSTGSSNAGNTYSFGLTNDRALGGLQSGSLIPTVGASFTNQTGTVITAIEIIYRGEQWRLGTAGRSDKLDFQYSLNATSLSSGTWIDADELDFNGPVSAGTIGALDGNLTANGAVLSDTISGLNIQPGSTFFIRWTDFNASGADDGLGVDNFLIRPHGTPSDVPAMSFTPAVINFGEVDINTYDTLSYRVVAANLTDSISVFTFNADYSISIDGVHFGSSATLTSGGGRIYVRFEPSFNGVINDSIFHVSGSVTKSLKATGKGFDPYLSIIPIAAARTQPLGTRVTVAGRITVANEQGNPAYVQDVTGGIPVFDAALATGVAIGDSVIVTGPIGVFNNQVQISGSGISFIHVGATPKFVQPKVIGVEELAAYEGQLVTVRQIHLVNKAFVFYPQSTEQITNDTATADLRIDGDTDIPGLTKPQNLFNVTGVVGRFRTNAQLLPRFRADIPGAEVPTTPADSLPKNKTLDIVNWNLEFFGARREDYPDEYGPADEALQSQNARTVLSSLQADIIAVQEVSDDSTFFAMVKGLGTYKALCSDRYSYSFNGPDNTFPPQKVCFIYDTLTVHSLSARALFENLYDSARLYDPSLLPGYPGGSSSSFFSSGRLPYLLNATVNIEGVETEISLIDIHAKSGSTAADRERRAYDLSVLKDSLDSKFIDRNFIILGDLNDDLDQSIVTGMSSPYQNFALDSAHYAPVTKALSEAGARSTVSFNDVIDHQILSDELKEIYVAGSAAIITPFGLISNYATTTSDHLPVITRYILTAPSVNFTQTGTSLPEENTSYTINLIASKASAQDKIITIALQGNATYGADFTTTPAAQAKVLSLILPAGATTTSFKVTILGDALDEINELALFTIKSFGSVAADSATFTLTIIDNDVPEVAFAKLIDAANEGAGDVAIKLKFSTPVATAQTITLQVYNALGAAYNSDYVTTPAVVNNKIKINVAAGSSEAVVYFTPLTDTRRELPELVTFTLSEVTSGLTMKNPKVSVFTILDAKSIIQLSVWPNPTNNSARISSEGLEQTDVVQAELRRSTGELIFSGKGTLQKVNDQLEHKIQSSPSGLYLIKIIHEGESYLLRVVKS